jgi:hypothetical protein
MYTMRPHHNNKNKTMISNNYEKTTNQDLNQDNAEQQRNTHTDPEPNTTQQNTPNLNTRPEGTACPSIKQHFAIVIFATSFTAVHAVPAALLFQLDPIKYLAITVLGTAINTTLVSVIEIADKKHRGDINNTEALKRQCAFVTGQTAGTMFLPSLTGWLLLGAAINQPFTDAMLLAIVFTQPFLIPATVLFITLALIVTFSLYMLPIKAAQACGLLTEAQVDYLLSPPSAETENNIQINTVPVTLP